MGVTFLKRVWFLTKMKKIRTKICRQILVDRCANQYHRVSVLVSGECVCECVHVRVRMMISGRVGVHVRANY